jgi:hypothetical protein
VRDDAVVREVSGECQSPTGAVLHGTTTRTVFGSVPAKFDDITIDRPGSGYTLVATSGTTTVTSGTFNVQ